MLSIYSNPALPESICVGNEYKITGIITQINGQTAITPSYITLVGTGIMPALLQVHISELVSNPENYESHLVGLEGVTKVSGTWPTSGNDGVITINDSHSAETFELYIDNNTNMPGSSEPVWPVDIQGMVFQNDNSSPYTSNYRLVPRALSDILPSGTLSVVLTGFTAVFQNPNIVLNWVTESELSMTGYRLYRNTVQDSTTALLITPEIIVAHNTAQTLNMNS